MNNNCAKNNYTITEQCRCKYMYVDIQQKENQVNRNYDVDTFPRLKE